MWIDFFHALLSTCIVAIAAFGIGTWIAPFFPDSLPPASRNICSWIGGLGFLGLILFVIGQWKFNLVVIGIVVAVGMTSAFVHFLKMHKFLHTGALEISRARVIPAAIVASVLLITAVAGLAEPVGDWGVDGVAYHYVGPKVWLRDGVVRPIPDNAPASYPSNVEMVFAALRGLGGDRAPGFSAFLTLSMLFLIAGALGVRCGLQVSGGWWIAALVATMPALYEGSHSGFVDAVYASFVLAAARIGFDARRKRDFAALGIFCGLAMATKYPGLLALPVIVLCSIWPQEGFRKSEIKKVFQQAWIAIIAACVVAAPLYLRNWLLLGSPIYPPPATVARFLHVKYFSPGALHAFYAWAIHRGQGHGRGLLELILLPFNLTYHTADFHGAGGIGLAPLALGPLGVRALWRDNFARRLAGLSLLLTLIWFVTMQESRYLISVYVLGAVFGVVGWRFANSLMGRRGKTLTAVVIALSLLYGLFMIGKARQKDIHSVFSSSFAQQRRLADIPFVQSFDFLNRDPSVNRLLILDPSIPAYYSDKDYLKPFGQWGEQVLPDASTPLEVLAKLRALRISHILDVHSSISGFRVPPNYPGLVLELSLPDQRVYRVVASGSRTQ